MKDVITGSEAVKNAFFGDVYTERKNISYSLCLH